MTQQNTQYTITWEVWNNMITSLGKAEMQLEKAMELLQSMINCRTLPQDNEALEVWNKCLSDYAKLKTEKEKYV